MLTCFLISTKNCHRLDNIPSLSVVSPLAASFKVSDNIIVSIARDEEGTMRKSSSVFTAIWAVLCCSSWTSVSAFAPLTSSTIGTTTTPTTLFFFGGGSGAKDLDEEWRKQQEILNERRKPKEEREKYFQNVEQRRIQASQEQQDRWAWQTKKYAKGEDPIDEWRKQRANGNISDLNDQYGDPKKIGGIPMPMASFGVGGEFGVG